MPVLEGADQVTVMEAERAFFVLRQLANVGADSSASWRKDTSRVVICLLVGLELQRAHDGELDVEAYRETVRTMLSATSPCPLPDGPSR